MKSLRYCICIMMLLTIQLNAFTQELIARKGTNKKYGYVDKKTNKWIIQPIYEYAHNFGIPFPKLGLVVCGEKNSFHYGFIDKDNHFVIKPEIQSIPMAVRLLKQSIIPVRINDKWGVIDNTGEYIIKPYYDYLSAFIKGVAVARLNTKWGAIDSNGDLVVPFEYEDGHMDIFSPFIIYFKKNGKWGAVDYCNLELIPFEYKKWNKIPDKANNKAQQLISDRSEKYTKFIIQSNENYRIAQQNARKLAYLNEYYFKDKNENGKYGFKNKQGQWVIQPIFDYVSDFKGTTAIASQNKKYGLINGHGEWKSSSCIYDNIISINDSIFEVSLNDRYGLINNNAFYILPCKYEYLSFIDDNLIKIGINGKYGIANNKGLLLSSCKYDIIDKFENGKANVWISGYKGVIDKQGKEIIQVVGELFEEAYKIDNSGDKDQALTLYQKILDIDPEHAATLCNIGVIYHNRGEYETAINYYEKSLYINPYDKLVKNNYKSAKAARSSEKWTQVAEALNNLSKSLNQNQNSSNAIYNNTYESTNKNSYNNSHSSHLTNCSQYQQQYNACINNIQQIRDSWLQHVETHGEVINQKNLSQIKASIRSIKIKAQQKGCTIKTSTLENWEIKKY